jgi:ribosomal protein S18 acetylase RimI-like enzyme
MFRAATPDDTERIIEIMHGEPGDEAVGLAFGSVELARTLGAEMVRLPNSPSGWHRTVFAVVGENPVGVLQASAQDVGLGDFITPIVVLRVARIFGPWKFVRGIPRIRARSRVEFDPVPDAYGVHELHVDAAYRNRGIGQAMLSYAEADARRIGRPRMSLTTTTSNPARRLYERNDYRIVATKMDPAYEHYTGIAGRHLMVKELE